MDTCQSFRLQDIIPIDEVEKIAAHFCAATKLITIVSDFRGVMLTSEKNTSYYTPFCKRLRLTKCSFGEYCVRSDALGSLEAAKRGEPFIYRCHMGFVEIAAPIVVNDMYLGAFLMGQVRTDPDKMDKIPQVLSSPPDLKSRPEYRELFERSFANSSFIPYDQLKAFAGLMACTANFIAQTAVNHTMRDQLNSSRIQYLEEQNRKAALEKHMAFLNLKNLRMRINPHFLFNTLNIVNSLAVLEDATQTSTAINALSDTLRISLKKQEQLVILREEIQCVKSYMYIQEMSTKGRIEFNCQVDEKCLDALIPLFSIELVVENACLHGLADVKSGGKLDLDIRQIGNFMHINVTDNGVGIDDALAEQFSDQSWDILSETETSSGLRSLMSNLRYFYGDEARWSINRLLTGGTHVQIIIPMLFSNTEQPDERNGLPFTHREAKGLGPAYRLRRITSTKL